MGTLQHFAGNLPSEAKRGKQRIEANRYKRWQTGKYVVLIAGLVAAFFGSAALGWLDPFSLLVRSFGLSILPAINVVARAIFTPLEHSHIAVIKSAGGTVHSILQVLVLDLRQPPLPAGADPGRAVSLDSGGQPARDAPCGAGRSARWARCWRCLALVASGAAQGHGGLQQLPTAACSTARAATIRWAACRGARPSA